MADNSRSSQPGRVRWLVYTFTALTILIILFGLAFLVSGREIIERPILVVFLLLAWLGLLSGIALGRSTN